MRLSHWLGIGVLLALLAATPGPGEATDANRFESLKRFSQVIELIEKSYVEDIDREELVTGALKGMLSDLDPHSAYMAPDAFEEMQMETSGEFNGVGIQISMENGRLTVVSPIEDTPAYEAGLQSGDVIMEINGESTQDITMMEAVKKIRGPKGSSVELTILHPEADKPETITVKRDTIPLESVKAEPLGQGYLYLRVTNFQEKTTDDLKKALDEHADSLSGAILDLRNNPGGLLPQAVSVADLFLDKGKIVYTEGKVKNAQMDFSAEKQNSDIDVPLIVLINSGSASGSEIVAGALQDHNRAVLLGERSFGKGSVQTVIPLADGAGIKLTTALYYTPDGRSIQAEGIAPDIVVPFVPPPETNGTARHIIREKDLTQHLERKDQSEEQGVERSEKAKELLQKDNQLRMALQLVKSLPRLQRIH
ncbi:MAG: S41 family peptidase [Thermodesulfobacteriota bacterium]